MKTRTSKTPTRFIRWKTREVDGSVRIYRVLDGASNVVNCIYIGKIYFGEFVPFLGKTKPVTKLLNQYVSFCTIE